MERTETYTGGGGTETERRLAWDPAIPEADKLVPVVFIHAGFGPTDEMVTIQWLKIMA